ncbi:DUF4102 domain-containing protein [Nostoc sp. LEGE 06077]|uniref:DUF4102 domain-containing protein n=1 Tax=Nostoc sp. LEGE 06077 TaxID=915325 RepID=UPI00187ED67E|nr:DUF4102 domain-containing protein [Nostoc sp. LEGE 06077]MBE9210516.1 DUF4102 domain-containing protein [Nostoc sp. LEGE 06077]
MTEQLTLFNVEAFTNYDESTEPPDPDHYQTPEAYEYAWQQWEKQYPELVNYAVAMSPCDSVGEQVTSVTARSDNTNNLVKFPTKKSAPQHDNHWVEKYWVERSGNKYWYYRYMWMDGRKLHRLYIGSIHSPKAKAKKLALENAIADGQTPIEIKQMLRGSNG